MKLRILNNSVRLRLTRSEVASAAAGDPIEAACQFGPGEQHTLKYRVMAHPDADGIEASFEAGVVTVAVPRDRLLRWATSDAIGMRREAREAPSPSPSLLIEKDFACLKPREGEEDSDTFPNPGAAPG